LTTRNDARRARAGTWGALVLAIVAGAAPAAAVPASATSTRYPFTVDDATGVRVVISARPRRIVSLAPSVTETLFALGLDAEVVGVSDADNFPPAKVARRSRIGSVAPSVERIVALLPDLVIGVPSLQRDHLARMRSIGLPVLAVDAESLAETFSQIRLLGRVLDRAAPANRLADALAARARAVQDGPAVSVYVEAWHEPLLAAGARTLVNDLVVRAGGTNVFADRRGYVQVPAEAVVARNPGVILMMYPGRTRVVSRSGWREVRAVAANRVHELPTDLVSRPGPRAVDGLELIARFLRGAGQP
jgi:iron complex transport system substrate-binding protein